MLSKIITLIVIVIIVLFVIFVLKDSGIKEKFKVKKPKLLDRDARAVVAGGPEIYVRYRPGEPYEKLVVKKTKFTIGKSPHCDLRLDFDVVEDVHAVIRMHNEDGKRYFTLQNLSQINGVEYLNQDNPAGNAYERLLYRESVELSSNGKDVFYIGNDVKLVIKCATKPHELSKTDFEVIKENNKEKSKVNNGPEHSSASFEQKFNAFDIDI